MQKKWEDKNMKKDDIRKIIIETIELLEKNEESKDLAPLGNIIKNYDDNEKIILELIEEHLYEWERWEKFILFLAAEAGDKSENLIKILLDHDDDRLFSEAVNNPDENKDLFRNMLFLAIRCQAESRCYDKSEIIEERLKKLLTRKEFFIRRAAVIALSELSKYSEEMLKFILYYIPSNDKSSGNRDRVIKIFEKAKVPLPEFILKTFKEETSPSLKYRLIKALIWLFKGRGRCLSLYNINDYLKKIGSRESKKFIIQVLKEEDSLVQINAINIIKITKWPEAIEPLTLCLKNEYYLIKVEAAEALGEIGDRTAILPLIKIFEDREDYVREKVAETLGKIGDRAAISPLIKALEDKKDRVREKAAEALGKIGDRAAISPLIKALEDRKYCVRARAIESLKKFDESVLNPLITALKKNSSVRAEVANILGQIGNRKALDFLLPLLEDESISVRKNIAAILGKIGEPEALKPLIKALNDDSYIVQREAVKSIKELGGKGSVPPLTLALNEYNSVSQENITKTVEAIGGKEAVNTLIKKASEADTDLARLNAVKLLGEIGEIKAIKPLIEIALGDDNYIKKRAEESLIKIIKIGNLELNSFISLLENKDASIRAEVVKILGNIRNKEIAGHLVSPLKDENNHVREEAFEALKKTGKSVLNLLPPLLKDENPSARSYAVKIFGYTGNKKDMDLLIPLLEDEDNAVRRETIKALNKISELEMKLLIPALKDIDASVRAEATRIIRQKEEEGVIEYLIFLLKDENAMVRREAVQGLCNLKEKKIIEHLIPLLQDRDDIVRENIVQAIKSVKDKKFTGHLVPLLRDKNSLIRGKAAEVLGLIKDRRAVEDLIIAARDRDSSIRKMAAEALRHIGDKRGAEAFITDLDLQDKQFQMNTADILGYIKDKRAIEPLIMALKGADKELQTSIIGNIGKIREPEKRVCGSSPSGKQWSYIASYLKKSEKERTFDSKKSHLTQQKTEESFKELKDEAVEVLAEILKNNKYSWMRSNMAELLGLVKDKRAVNPLLKALEDPDWLVRRNAVEALGGIEDEKRISGALVNMLNDENAMVLESVIKILKNKSKEAKVIYPLKKSGKLYISENKISNVIPRLLVVDDEPEILEIFEHIFRKNYKVKTALNGKIALDLILEEEKSFDVIITGLNMPMMKGIELISKLVCEYNIAVPTITMTGFASLETAIKALKLGVFDYLLKPFDTIAELMVTFEKARRVY